VFNHYLQCNLLLHCKTHRPTFLVTISQVQIKFNGLRMSQVDGRLVASDACAMRRKKVLFTVSG